MAGFFLWLISEDMSPILNKKLKMTIE